MGHILYVIRPFIIQKRLCHITQAELYRRCYEILGCSDSAEQNTVRHAYIELVKKVHPDSGLPDASSERFQQVNDAFNVLQEKFAKDRRGISEFQYLSFDGVGSGNPFQRQKQYQTAKAISAQEQVLTHRLKKAQSDERTIVKKGSFFKNHAIKTKYGFDRIVEDLIQEAMSKGDFTNLRGAGKPLKVVEDKNHFVDFTTHKLNKVLLENGFLPEWIMLQRDIREAIHKLKNDIKEERAFFGDYPFSDEDDAKWKNLLCTKYEHKVQVINKSIDKYNLIVPILNKQQLCLNLNKISEEILNDRNLRKNFKKQATSTLDSASSKNNNKSKSDFLSFFASFIY